MRSGMLLVIASRAMMPMLIIEFLIGSYVSLFSSFPPHTAAVDPFTQIFTASGLWLALHVVLGFAILGLSLAILAFGAVLKKGSIALLGTLGLVTVTFTIVMGIEFVLGGYSDNVFSYGMSAGFIFSFVLYGALAGRVNFFLRSMKRADTTET